MSDSNIPSSPDTLSSGIRGRVEGVTRIGPRAMLVAMLVTIVILASIMYGMFRTPPSDARRVATNTPVIAPPQPSDGAHFGQNVPIVESPLPDTPSPAIVLPASPAPVNRSDGDYTPPPTGGSPATPSAADVALARRIDDESRRIEAEDKARADALERANTAPILTGGATAQTSSPVQGMQQPIGATGSATSVSNANARGDTLPASRQSSTSAFELTAGSVVPAALVTGLDSEQPGLVVGQIREDVYDARTGRYLLIPRGARLIGSYKSDVTYGKSRVVVAWQRLIFPDTTSIDLLNMPGADVQGGAGFGGTVDNHTGKIIGATLLSSVLSAAVALSQPRTQTVATTVGGSVAIPSVGQQAAQGAGASVADVGQSLVAKNLDIPPVVHVPKGYPFVVVVDRDIVFTSPYEPRS